MIRKIKIELNVHMDDGEAMADLAVPALLEYCGAVLCGDAGDCADEHFMAENGITLHCTHTVQGA